MKDFRLTASLLLFLMLSCNSNKKDFDASGNFEADEVIVSAQQTGQLIQYVVKEGDRLTEGQVVGQVDVRMQQLQKEQTEASIAALTQKTSTAVEQVNVARRQLAVQQSQLEYLIRERQRVQNLINEDAAPRKNLDDLEAQVEQMQKQIAVTKEQINLFESNTSTQNRAILSERNPLQKAAAQIEVQISKGQVVNPVGGTVLSNYALRGEMAVTGKPLYKIANTDTLFLRAYITGDELPKVKQGQQVQVRIDDGDKKYKYYTGTITWISARSEFTPKTIQTKNERANLVYATKVRVVNDGYLKIGMYGEVVLNNHQ